MLIATHSVNAKEQGKYKNVIEQAIEEQDVRRAMLIDEYIQRGLEDDGFEV